MFVKFGITFTMLLNFPASPDLILLRVTRESLILVEKWVMENGNIILDISAVRQLEILLNQFKWLDFTAIIFSKLVFLSPCNKMFYQLHSFQWKSVSTHTTLVPILGFALAVPSVWIPLYPDLFTGSNITSETGFLTSKFNIVPSSQSLY